MLTSVNDLYKSYNESFPSQSLSNEYLSLYQSTIEFVNFSLLDNQAADVEDRTTVQITLRGSKRYGAGEGKPVLAEMTSNIRLVN